MCLHPPSDLPRPIGRTGSERLPNSIPAVKEPERPIYVKDAPRRVFDVHAHYPWRAGAPASPLQTPEGMLDTLVYTCGRLNIHRICLLGRRGESNDWVERAFVRYPDLIVPFAQVDPDADTPAAVADLADRGFRGLKIINPRRDYDHPAYFPLYAEAERRRLVCLFHTGIAGGPVDYLQFPPRTVAEGTETSRASEALRRYSPEATEGADSWYGAARMQPILLDGVSVAFPDLSIVGAHLGYGLYDSAAAVARWRRNVSFDISGGTVVRRHIIDRGMIRAEVSTAKLLWGSDCDVAHMSRELSSWMAEFERIGLSAAEQDAIFWGNAARIFGVEDASS